MTLLNVPTTPLCFVPNLLEGEDNYDVLFRLVTSYTAIHGVPLQYSEFETTAQVRIAV